MIPNVLSEVSIAFSVSFLVTDVTEKEPVFEEVTWGGFFRSQQKRLPFDFRQKFHISHKEGA